jgi:hypothetical protein
MLLVAMLSFFLCSKSDKTFRNTGEKKNEKADFDDRTCRSTFTLGQLIHRRRGVKRIAMTLAAGATALMPQAVKAEPQVLTAAQMDNVTAGGFVDVAAFAGASGDFAQALTNTNTNLVVGPWYEVGQGIAVASSFGCCGFDAEAVAATLAVGADENVRSSTHMDRGGFFVVSYAVVAIFVISRTPGGVFHTASLAGAEMSP